MKKKAITKTPPMGWNSWDCFGAGVNEKQLLANADYMAAHLKDCGWQYIVCDIQWYEPCAVDTDYNNFACLTMDDYGRLMPAVNRFPSAEEGGFTAVADYCHSKGLKFGIHIMRGIPRQAVHADTPIKNSEYTARQAAHHFSVCSWNTDMYGMKNCRAAQDYYNSIIEMYAAWGVDFIKCDDICVTEFRKWDNPYSADYEIEMIRNAIDRTGRDIVLSLSPGPADIKNKKHLADNAHMWRLTGDFWDQWDKLHDMFDKCKEWQGVSSPGAYPDCDMLPLGRLCKNGRCHGAQNRMTQFTIPEQYTMMTLWGIFRSPLFMGGNLPECDDFTLSLLTNKDYFDMYNNSFGAKELYRNETGGQGTVIWASNGKGCKYIAVFNTKNKQSKITVELRDILMPDTRYNALDIWSGDKYTVKNRLVADVAPHGAALIRLN